MQGNDRPVAGSGQPRRQRRADADAAGGRASRAREAQQAEKASPEQAKSAATSPTVPRLLQRYRADIAPALMEEFGYTVPLQVPRLTKVVLNVGVGEAITNANVLETVTQMLATISGQRPVVTKARRSIAGFKLREGMRIGAMVTLRSRRMYEFVDRLLNAALPRIRDFRGVPRTSFDGRGNYSLGLREQVMFPEIDYNRVDRIRGFQVSFVTTAGTDREALRLLELMGMPFARGDERE